MKPKNIETMKPQNAQNQQVRKVIFTYRIENQWFAYCFNRETNKVETIKIERN